MSSNTYGYIADTGPTQAYGSNNGVFDPADINDLIAENKWSGVGNLELIETQSVSGVSAIDFTSIQGSTYDVHFLTTNDMTVGTDGAELKIRLYESGVLETASVYQCAFQRGRVDGTFTEYYTTTRDSFWIGLGTGNASNETQQGYFYFYNLNDSTKYSFNSYQLMDTQTDAVQQMIFGSCVLPQASKVDGIRFYPSSGTVTGTASLYGIRYS